MNGIEHRTQWVAADAAPTAVSEAKSLCDRDGWRVLTIVRVAFEPHAQGPGWRVTLAVRAKEAPATT